MSVSSLIPFDLSFNLKENTTYTQFAYDISGAESGGLAGHSISKNLAGDIIAVGAPLNSGGGTARGEVRVYQKDNDSWLQLGADLNGTKDNEEFGHSLDLNGDGTILAVGTKDLSHNTLVYKYDSGSWGLYGNIIYNNVSSENTFTVEGETIPSYGTTVSTESGPAIWANLTTSDETKILASNRAASDTFSYDSVAIDGNYAIIGANGQDTIASGSGAAYIFELDTNGTWTEVAFLKTSDMSLFDNFGCSVAISGNYAVVGCRGEDTTASGTGAAYIFERDTTTGIWGNAVSGQSYYTENQMLKASDLDASDGFGRDVSIHGTYAIIGAGFADADDITNAGKAYIFERDTNGIWGTAVSGESYNNENQILALNNPSMDYFGYSVAINGNYAIVGAYRRDSYFSDAGEAYIFERDTNGIWGTAVSGQTYNSATVILQASNKTNNTKFGGTVAINGNYAMVGSGYESTTETQSGAVWVFERDENGNWGTAVSGESYYNENQILKASNIAAYLYFAGQANPKAVSISGNYAIVGAYGESTLGENDGAAYIFERNSNGVWEEIKYIKASDVAGNSDRFGTAVAISGSNAIVASHLADTTDESGNEQIDAGAAYFYKAPTSLITNFRVNTLSASTKPKFNKTGDKLTIFNEKHFQDLSSNGFVQSYQYNESDASWNYLGDKIESAAFNDISGGDIAINDEGNMIAIGYPQTNSATGTIKVYKYDTSWNQIGSNIDGSATGDHAGTSVVIDGSGDLVAIGSPFAGDASAGEVNVYQNVADTWTLYGNKIEGQSDNDEFGSALDMTPAGNILAVGAPNANAVKGNVNIYQYNTTDNSWNQLGGDLSGAEVGDLTGTSVKLNQLGTEVSVGEPTSNRVLPQAHSNATLFWYFAQNITTSTIGGDTGTEGTFRGDDGVGDDEVMTVTLTESEGFQSIAGSSEQLRVTSKNYVFPSDTFTIEFYVNVINLDETYPKIFDYQETSGGSKNRFMINKDNNTTSLRMKIWNDSSSLNQKSFNQNIDWQFDTWYHAVFVCDMANASGPTVSMYQNGVLTQTNTWSAGVWNREPGFDRELGVSTTYAYKGDAPNQNIKRFQIIDGLLDATEVAALYDNREAQASSIGGARTFELSHTKNYEANTFQSSYLDGFLDISGGELRTRNADDHLLIGGDASMSGNIFVKGNETIENKNIIISSTLIDISFSQLENTNFTQYAYDISGVESGGLAGHSISTSASGDIIAVGAPLNSGGGTARGEVRVYQKNNDSWLQLGSDLNGTEDNDEFGHSLDLNEDGTILAVGSKNATHKTAVYKYASGSWNLYGNTIENNVSFQNYITTAPMASGTSGTQLGSLLENKGSLIVSLNGDGTIAATGDPYENNNKGVIRVFQYNGSDWTQLGTDINGPTNYDRLGYTISLSSDGTIVAGGAYWGDGSSSDQNVNHGEVRVYQYNGSDWTQLGSFIEGDVAGDNLGYSVSLSGDGTTVASGSLEHNNDKGQVKVHRYNGSSWIQLGSDFDGESSGYFGNAVSLNSDGTIVAIGAYRDDTGGYNTGIVRVYQYNGSSWTQLGGDIYGEDSSDQIGREKAMSLSGDGFIIAIGSVEHDNGKGTCRIYQYSNSTWTKLGNDIDGEVENEYSGRSVSISRDGTVVAIGSMDSNNVLGVGPKGHVRIYQYTNSAWTKIGNDYLGDNGSQAGVSVSLNDNGSIVAIGAQQEKVRFFETGVTVTNQINVLSAPTKPKLNKTGDKLSILNEYYFEDLSTSNGFVQSYQYSESDASWNYLGDKIESASVNDISGGDLAINEEGNMIAIGNPQTNSATGTTKVFKYDTSWNQIGSNIDGSATGDHAGTSVVIDGSGDFVAIGSPFAGDASAGEVNVYQNVADTWTLYGNKIQGQADNDQFGTSIDIDPSGNILAVGAVNANGGKGNVNIYQYNETDSSWNKVGGDLSGDAVGDLTGTSVKLNQLGTEVSVGEPESNSTFYYTPWTYASQTQLDWNFLFDGSTSVTSSISGHVGTYVVGSNVTAANETYHGKSTASGGFASTKSSSNNLEDGAGITGIDIPHGNATKFTYEFYFDFGTKTYADNDGCILITTTETATTLNGWVEISINGENFECKYYDDSDDSGSYYSFTAENPAGSTGTGKQHIVIATHFMANAAAFEAHVNGVAGAQGNDWSSGKGPGTHDTRWLNLLGCHDRTLPNTGNGWQANLLFFRLHKFDWSDQWYQELYNIREPISERYGGARTFEIEHTKIYEHEYNTQSNSVIVGHNEYSRNQFATALDVSGNVDVSGSIVLTGNVTIPGDITLDALNYNSINKAPPVSIDYSDITEDLSFNHKIEIMTNDNSLQTSSLTIHNDLSNNGTFGSSFVYDNSLSVTGSVFVVDASNTNYGSYTVYSKGDGSDSFMVGKSASHVFNIVNQSNVGVWMPLDGNSFISTSDESLKKDIEDLGEETDSIMKLRPVKFHWNYEEEDKEKHIGFIAQEVEELFPDLVEENTYPDGSTYKGVDKTKLIPHLVNEIKSIKKEIEELKK